MQRGVIIFTPEEVVALYNALVNTNMARTPIVKRIATCTSHKAQAEESSFPIEMSAEEIEAILDEIILPEDGEVGMMASIREKLNQKLLSFRTA